jgi:hypothetical protein
MAARALPGSGYGPAKDTITLAIDRLKWQARTACQDMLQY